jgi:hypothetical protein
MFQAVLRDTVNSQYVPLLRWRNLNLEREYVATNCNNREGWYSFSYTSPLN